MTDIAAASGLLRRATGMALVLDATNRASRSCGCGDPRRSSKASLVLDSGYIRRERP